MSLLNFLKNEENSRKIFGQRELKIIEKQLSGINLTQSEKNRLSRDIRKKFDFIRKVSRFEEEFELTKGAEVKKIILEAKKVILNDVLVKKMNKIVLFGSTAENKLNYSSDIDLAVIFDNINLKDATLFRKRVLGNMPDKVDIQVYNILPQKIKQEIDQKGKVLYVRKQD